MTCLDGLRDDVNVPSLLLYLLKELSIFSLLADDDDGPEAKRTRTDSPAAGYSGMPAGPMLPGAMQRPTYGPQG